MVADGKTVYDWIREYVPQVNEEFGLSDRNEKSIAFFDNLVPLSDYIIDDWHYLWVLPSFDMWGDSYLIVVSFYIKPQYRTVKNFRKLQDEIIMLAKKHKSVYIIQGSHLNGKLHKILSKMGYETAQMMRRV